MSQKALFSWIWFAFGIIGGFIFLGLSFTFAGENVGRGSVPSGGGWAALLMSAASTVVPIFISYVLAIFDKTPAVGTEDTAEVIELTVSFLALIKDRSSKAAQRRFLFALADSADFIPGVASTIEDGVIVIRYSGFAEKSTPVT